MQNRSARHTHRAERLGKKLTLLSLATHKAGPRAWSRSRGGQLQSLAALGDWATGRQTKTATRRRGMAPVVYRGGHRRPDAPRSASPSRHVSPGRASSGPSRAGPGRAGAGGAGRGVAARTGGPRTGLSQIKCEMRSVRWIHVAGKGEL